MERLKTAHRTCSINVYKREQDSKAAHGGGGRCARNKGYGVTVAVSASDVKNRQMIGSVLGAKKEKKASISQNAQRGPHMVKTRPGILWGKWRCARHGWRR